MPKVRAKFVCDSVQDQPDYNLNKITFSPVVDGSEENESFSKFTPSGKLELDVSYETPASGAFEIGKSYYLDLTPAD